MDENSNPTSAEIDQARKVLESLAQKRSLLNEVGEEKKRALLRAAGLLSRPDKYALRKQNRDARIERKSKRRNRDFLAKNKTGIRQQRESDVYIPAPREADSYRTTKRLEQAQNCYVCKKEYRELHFFYDSMCPDCGALNYEKRFQTADLKGRVVLITGGRVKIGFQASLILLRSGAHVIATTRFPNDAALRYEREDDFSDWKDRLHIYGLDLRHSPSVEILAGYLNRHYDRLDLILNNAAQTVRRPPGFYRHLLEGESGDPPAHLRPLVEGYIDCKATLSKTTSQNLPATTHKFSEAAAGIKDPAGLSQIPYSYDESTNEGLEVFPVGAVDADLQQVDLRKTNSWRLALADVPTPEMLEVYLVNAVAPFVLNGKLKPLMTRTDNRDKHIVNVSAMEGQFARHTKTDKHPHTNMAKAALNMMTFTSAADYVQDGIHMNAVDTGWVTDEDPAQHADRKRDELNFQPPLDIVDGAARICDPYLVGINTGNHAFGKFFKDYRTTRW